MQSSSPSSTTGPRPALALLLLAALLAAGSPAQTAPVLHGPPPTFTDVAGSSGLRFRHTFGADKLQSILMTTGSGCAFFDYDNDGFLDAFMVNGTYLDEEGRPRADKVAHHGLYHNRGDGTFENVSAAAGITAVSYGQGVTCADYDGDGFTDLYLTNYGPNILYRNLGDGHFADVTAEAGVAGGMRWSSGAVFFDYDGDLDLDLFVASYVKYDPGMDDVHASSLSKRIGFRFFPGPRDYEGEDDILFRNNGDGTFTDVTDEVGLLSGGKGLTVAASDFDGDGDQDLFVANDSTPNFLYRNDAGHFTEIALEAGVAYDPDGVETAGMGVAVADVDGDGNQDLYVTNMVFEFNNMYRNLGDMVFDDVSRATRLNDDNYRHVGWATHFADFNHDGFLDCFVANGHVVDYVEGFSQSITYGQQNMLFLGDGRNGFTNVANDCGKCWQRKRVTRGAGFGDFDNDGDIDILILNSGGRCELLRNDLPPNDRWIKIKLSGLPPNTAGLGAKVTTRVGKRVLHEELRFAPSYLSSSEPILHIGLRPGEATAEVEVLWPAGTRTRQKVAAGTMVTIAEPPAAATDQ